MERPLTEHIRAGEDPPSLEEYERTGGYQALRKALGSMTPAEVTQVVADSGLRGRGGAGFPTGRKWQFIPIDKDAPRPKYLIANADEMEPGTFKDRLLLRGHPHQLIEGMILAAYAIQADQAYIFVRWAYKLAARRLSEAIAEAYANHYLGQNILGLGYDLELHLHTSAGRYICGEATALLNALEGERGIPRSKPPHAAAAGLWSKPTVVNNVETLSNVPHIVNKGAAWFKGLSLTEESGTKLYQVSGKVKHPGVWDARRGDAARAAPWWRLDPVSPSRASRLAHGFSLDRKGREPVGYGHDHCARRPDVSGGHGWQLDALFCSRVVRMVHTLS
jgi:NADH-quinone oxidoreductase subunit F